MGSNHNTQEFKMKTRERFLYMVLGGVFSATLIFIGMAVSPLTAQKDTFGEITCTGLRVLYPDGTVAVYVGQGNDNDGGRVTCYNPTGNARATMQVSGSGKRGSIVLTGETGIMVLNNEGFSMANIPTVLGLEINSRGHPLFRIADVSNKDKVQKVEIEVTASGLLTLWENDEFEGLGLLNYLTRP